MASQGNALLGTISVPGETRIKVLGSIGNAASGSLVQTGNIILEAANGDIGYVPPGAVAPLDLSPLPGATITARAENGVNIDVAAANPNDTNVANVDTIYSPQDIVLTATGSILNANDDNLVNILGNNVTLVSSKDRSALSQTISMSRSSATGGSTRRPPPLEHRSIYTVPPATLSLSPLSTQADRST